ncbi:SDR family NAD(P)-dependent oxidoreductase [Micromonospora sp. NPDC005087]|uniref:SDR family NAD(P)-dependent oxidoreductase n=1 Tax=Micromonospora sp. NPDC005087 TaxID=3364225 RepID=UPI003682476E
MSDSFLGFPSEATVIVTGAGSGIGAQFAAVAARAGLAVAAWDLNTEAATAVTGKLTADGHRALAVTADVTDPAAVAEALRRTRGDLPPARYLFNNAGPPSFTKLDFNAAVATALGSVYTVTQAWLDGPESRDGSLVNVSSVAGAITGAGANNWYSSAKAGIAGLTRYLALNRPNGIRANAVAPGVIDTPRTQGLLDSDYGKEIVARNPMGRVGRPADVAHAALFLLSPAAEYINGVLLPVDGGSLLVL